MESKSVKSIRKRREWSVIEEKGLKVQDDNQNSQLEYIGSQYLGIPFSKCCLGQIHKAQNEHSLNEIVKGQ
jgi:hypothetical protein